MWPPGASRQWGPGGIGRSAGEAGLQTLERLLEKCLNDDEFQV